MDNTSVLVTGGCGFVGSSLAIRIKDAYPTSRVTCLDNLKRRGSELNIPRLKARGIEFLHGDIRNKEDLEAAGDFELLIECSAEPSVLAGFGSSPEYLVNTNLVGTINCLELARRRHASFIFLSTSRVYPVRTINSLNYVESETRFELAEEQIVPGVSADGFSEHFPLEGARSLYGATKLCSELLVQEYVDMYGMRAVVNRCGLLTGPWQFGKVDQGVIVLWVAQHYWKKKLSYIGFGGQGKQVRDLLHVDDLFTLLDTQVRDIQKHSGQVYNVGGGREVSVSLKELTALCQEATGNTIDLEREEENRPADIRIFLSDTTKVQQATGWVPQKSARETIYEIVAWIRENETVLHEVLQ